MYYSEQTPYGSACSGRHLDVIKHLTEDTVTLLMLLVL